MGNILQMQFYGNSLYAYFWCLIWFVLAVIAIWYFKKVILHFFEEWSQKNSFTLGNIFFSNLDKNLIIPAYYLAFLLCISRLNLPNYLQKGINIAALIIFTYFGVCFSLGFLFPIIDDFIAKNPSRINSKHTSSVVKTILKVVLWTIAIIALLDNLGIKVSALVTGLGIGGIAIALAAQSVLGDLFSYFIIYFDRPFEPGDFIVVGDFMGTVENIGIKTTRIRSLSGEEIIFSNTDLTSSRVRNHKRMHLRRILFKFGVTYQTPLDKLKEIPNLVKEIIEIFPDVKFERAHFASFGDFSLVYEVVYYVLSNEYNRYMDIQQQINFRLKEELEKRNISFAYPTQTIFVSQTRELT